MHGEGGAGCVVNVWRQGREVAGCVVSAWGQGEGAGGLVNAWGQGREGKGVWSMCGERHGVWVLGPGEGASGCGLHRELGREGTYFFLAIEGPKLFFTFSCI